MRALKALLVAAMGAWAAGIAFDSVADYGASWSFLRHVLALDALLPQRVVKYRALSDPNLQAVAYWSIIAAEWTIGGLCLLAGWRLFAAGEDRPRFRRGRSLAVIALLLALALYAIGFAAPRGEWMAMWRSSVWHGQHAADVFAACCLAVLALLLITEKRQDG